MCDSWQKEWNEKSFWGKVLALPGSGEVRRGGMKEKRKKRVSELDSFPNLSAVHTEARSFSCRRCSARPPVRGFLPTPFRLRGDTSGSGEDKMLMHQTTVFGYVL